MTVIHLAQVAEPVQASLSEDDEHAWYACLGKYARICNTVLPGDAQELSEAKHVKGVVGSTESGLHCLREGYSVCMPGTPSSLC